MINIRRVYGVIVIVLPLIMVSELVLILREGHWLTAFLVGLIIAITLAPVLLRQRLPVNIPLEFQLLAIGFVFAALFLGEVRDYYQRIWWWDIALHTISGLLLGIVGFLLVYVLNEYERVELHLRPRFVALFAFLFAVAVGTLWELFEFFMDIGLGLQMQKAMFGDPSGLTDTMVDLLVDMLGALVISLLGLRYMQRHEPSFISEWIRKFIDRNPRLFRRRGGY